MEQGRCYQYCQLPDAVQNAQQGERESVIDFRFYYFSILPSATHIKRRIRYEISRPVRLTGGDSASALRALRNGAPRTGAKGEKEGRRNRRSGANCVSRFCVCDDAGAFLSAALLFSPLSSAGKHHSAANVVSERNLQQKAMSFT